MASEEEKADEAAAAKYSGRYDINGAAIYGDVGALRHFLRVAPGRVHETFGGGFTPLHGAAANGQVAAAEFLISKGAAVDAKSNSGATPLHRAAFFGHVKVAELLLSKGAAMDAKDDKGETPFDLARKRRQTEMEQFLLNWPAKKASADDGKMSPDLSSKGKAEMEPFPTAADKTSEADKKAQQTPRRQTSKEADEGETVRQQARDALVKATADGRLKEILLESKDPSSPAGSGAAAAKHQREVSKEEAARELKKAMESGNAKVLKDAIDKAKLHTVSPEEVMEAMDKYIALLQSADGAALSPAQEAARELKKAMESGNAKVLEEALAKAKLHKVSPEEVMEAMDKYIALLQSADPAAPSKPEEATTSKAESSVKLEPGHGARLAMFSARFNKKNKDTEMKFRAVHKLLVENHYEILMVEAGAGKSFGDKTLEYLFRLQQENGVMLAVCTSDYGEMTDSPFCTYYELKVAKEYNVDVLPLQVEDNWKPSPPCGEGHLDHSKSALSYIHAVFLPSIVRIDCRNKPVDEIAREIAAALRKAS